MTECRFLLDENLGLAIRFAVRRRLQEVPVWAIGDPGAPSLGTLDPAILEWCEVNGFILVTRNRASMPVHLANHLASGRHVSGIFILAPAMGAADIAGELTLIVGASRPDEYRDGLHYLPLSE